MFPSEGLLKRLVGAVVCEQDKAWFSSRYLSETRMWELGDRLPGTDGTVGPERLEEAHRTIEVSLELADGVEAAQHGN